MFWIGQAIALIGGLLGISFAREVLAKHFPGLTGIILDVALILLLVVGLGIGAKEHLSDEWRIELLTFQEVATYNANGNRSGSVIGVRMVPTPIDDWAAGFLSRPHGELTFQCGSTSIAACRTVIGKLPTFPFGYYFLALCLKENGNSEWRSAAKTARSILRKTTQLPIHHADHNLALDGVEKLLTQ